MPEFPEVNIQVRYLRERVKGWKITDCGWNGDTHLANLPEDQRKAVCKSMFADNEIVDVTQRGKQIIFRMRQGIVTSHLMFRGRWSVVGDHFISNYKRHRDPPTESSNSFWLIGAQVTQRLNFYDPEYRAHVKVFPHANDPTEVEEVAKLGPEVLVLPETDPSFADAWTVEEFRTQSARSKQAIKAFLLDQKRQSGIGNIYVCEALYRARIDPNRPAQSLSSDEAQALFEATRSLMQKAIDTNLDYDQVVEIYNCKKDPNGHPVSRDKVGGRDTFWVPAVQK
jgi:formamidopyrimidine-DNA glycosylase